MKSNFYDQDKEDNELVFSSYYKDNEGRYRRVKDLNNTDLQNIVVERKKIKPKAVAPKNVPKHLSKKKKGKAGKVILTGTLACALLIGGYFGINAVKNSDYVKSLNDIAKANAEDVISTSLLDFKESPNTYEIIDEQQSAPEVEEVKSTPTPTVAPTVAPTATPTPTVVPTSNVAVSNQKATGDTLTISFDNRCGNEKNQSVIANYEDIITKYANMYGIDPELMIAIASQESYNGIHDTKIHTGSAIGLFQIESAVFIGGSFSAYNFETGKTDTFSNITKEQIMDLDFNVKMACALERYNIDNLPKNMRNLKNAINAYNHGLGAVISNNTASNGDQQYVEHVLSYVKSGTPINLIISHDGTNVLSTTVTNSNVKDLTKTM